MPGPYLPSQIFPFKYARQGRRLQGQLALQDMSRLVESLVNDNATINVDLQLDFDEQNVSSMRGHLQVDVTMVCQRCMSPMTVPLETNVVIGFVSSDEQAANLPDGYEPCIVESETMLLADIIEEELILALPIVALHADQGCEPLLKQHQDELAKAVLADEQDKKNPFAVLSDLKRH